MRGHLFLQPKRTQADALLFMGANYSPNGFTLQFDNGTIWQRAPELPPPPPLRSRLAAASGYFVMRGRVDAGEAAACGEMTSVSHAFQLATAICCVAKKPGRILKSLSLVAIRRRQ